MRDRDAFRSLPSVDEVLRTATARLAIDRFGRPPVVGAVRATLDSRDARPRQGRAAAMPKRVAATALARLEADAVPSLRPVFNLTGTVLHTNLGRALLAEEAVDGGGCRPCAAPWRWNSILRTGERGERDDHVRGLLCELTGAEDATVVNNNAAAVLLVLNTLGARAARRSSRAAS